MKKMSPFILLCIIVLSSFSTVITFSGKWGRSTKTTDFSLDLKQKGDSVIGSHISVMQNGDKVDTGADTLDITIRGVVDKQGIATVTFTSGFGENNTGTATIKHIVGNQLEWQITAKPKEEYFIPDHAILKRD